MKDQYIKFKKKYDLPDYEELNKEFEISTIEKDEFFLREIRRKIMEKIDFYSKLIEEMLQPDSSVASIYECRVLNDDEKKQLFELYKRLMAINRSSIKASLKDEHSDALFINNSFKEWPELKKRIIFFVDKMKESWEKETNKKFKAEYLG